MMDKEKRIAINWVEEHKGRIIEISDAIWGFAELGFVEFKSSKLLADELEAHGFSVERGVAGIPTAFVATWGTERPVIGVIGEYDALPGLSQKAIPHKEPVEEGAPGHGCGHNIIGTSGIGGSLATKAAMEREGIKGTIKFFGCPAEEMLSGKVWMVRDGVFDGIDAIIGQHPGVMNVANLSSSTANNVMKFHFYGRTAHTGASPEYGRSALDALELMNVGVNYLREHIIQDARISYVIEKGGGQPNVVPDYACSWYLIRAPERDQVEAIYQRIIKIAEGAALMTETTLKVEFVKGVYNMIPNRTMSELITANMREIGSPEYTKGEMEFAQEISKSISIDAKRDSLRKSKRPGWEKLLDIELDRTIPDVWNEGEIGHHSSDTSDVSWQAPHGGFNTTTYVLGTPGHSWQNVAMSGMSIGHKSLIFASKIIAASVIDLLTKPDLLKAAKEELDKRLMGKTYKSPVPPEAKPSLDQWTR